MAFNTAPANTNTAASSIPANKKAVGFLNLYMPTANGGRRKIGAAGIPLREANDNERTLAEWLAKDPEARVKLLLDSLIVEYNSVEVVEGSEFLLPGDPADAVPEVK